MVIPFFFSNIPPQLARTLILYRRYVMAFNHLLVETNVFQKVKVSFLPVGHTHDDVDQFFSKINAVLQRRDILTITDLHTAVTDSFLPVPVCTHLDDMGMFKPWFEKFLVKTIKGIMGPRVFLFTRTPQKPGEERLGVFERSGNERLGKVGQFYRQQLQSTKTLEDCWFPSNNTCGFRCFKEFGSLDRSIPEMGPVFRVPYKATDVAKLRETVASMAGLMSPDQRDWWEQLLASLAQQGLSGCKECQKLRKEQQSCAANKMDLKEVRNAKSNKLRKSLKQLQLHMASNLENHPGYQNFWPPTRHAAGNVKEDDGIFSTIKKKKV